ncbi:chorismate mutase [Parasedimentitalea maritima]|uniref:chorismate mutase n=1 Tax=Parasedimentitalea maritima TaxID=2578117 RepID=A0A5R8YY76_9RHOB|nr:chorismate mutase [Zongyanglinia marina]KAE9627345.1 chorismate mutase [Zongyanglinia marina]TLP58393.1 chorismate mutase [Zongyanglinia marina]
MTQLTSPHACTDMSAVRAEIDKLDATLVSLLRERAAYIDRAIALKQINGWPARIPQRVEDVVSKVRDAAGDEGLDPELVDTLWRHLIDWSIAREARVIREI